LNFLNRILRKRTEVRAAIVEDKFILSGDIEDRPVLCSDIIQIIAFARDDYTHDTLGITLVTANSATTFSEDVKDFSEVFIELGARLGFDGEGFLRRIHARQISSPLSEWRECVWKRN